MGTIYVDTGGNAANSGSTDNTSPLTGTSATRTGANTVQLDALTDLSSVVIAAGPTQSCINIAGATNANTTIFWITNTSGSGGATPTLTVTPDPTGMTTNSWRIGGQYLWPSGAGVNVIEGGLRAGDVLQFNNTPATKSVTYITARTAGDSTSGPITLRGKAGVRPVLNVTNTSVVLTLGQVNWLIQNVELDQDGASGNVVTATGGNGIVFDNIKISDGGGEGISSNAILTVINSEITGCGANGISVTGSSGLFMGNYIHGNTTAGIATGTTATPTFIIVNNIIAANGAQGINFNTAPTSQAHTCLVAFNTIYGNGNSGLEVADADTCINLRNNIFVNNGDAANEYNVEWVAGSAELHGSHGYNVFFSAGGGGSGNLFGLTANATESTVDPALVAPGSGNFAIPNNSSAASIGYPGQFLGSNLGYLDAGAVQRQSGGGGFVIGN